MGNVNNRLFVFLHSDEKEQNEFVAECYENGYFVEPIKFMVRQKPEVFGVVEKVDKKVYSNGSRPYMSISNANPNEVGRYYNWSYLESVIQTGWKLQFREYTS